MGWSLCTMDYQKGNYRIPHKLPKKDNVTIIPMAFEENKEINLSVALWILNVYWECFVFRY